MKELVKVNLHGELGKNFGKLWELSVFSVGEALNAINQLLNGKFYQFLGSKNKKGAKNRVLINGEDFLTEKPLIHESQVEDVKKTNLVVKISNLKTIDVVPLLEGADSGIVSSILGVLLIVVGIATIVLSGGTLTMLGVGIIMIGAGLLAAGITALLSKPPTFDDFRTIGGNAKVSYLFDGPQNVTKEGGPVPVGYGRLLVGSQVIGASYVVKDSGGIQDLSNVGGGTTFYVWATIYTLRSTDPLYDPNLPADKIQKLWGGYYEATADQKNIYIYRPLPRTVQANITHGFPYNTSFVGPDPSFNPFPNDDWNGKAYPYNT